MHKQNTAKKNVEATPLTRSVKQIEVGRIMSVEASAAVISVNKSVISNNQLHLIEIGTVLKILTNNSLVIAMVSSLKVGTVDNENMHDSCIAHLSILGEISTNKITKETKFFRGVRTFPVLNQPVLTMSSNELQFIFSPGNEPSIAIGRMQQDDNIVARVKTNNLLSKHFAIFGSTGSGKSCMVAHILQTIINENPNGHVVLFDPHNEYAHSFGDQAKTIGQTEFDLPLWLFNFEETVEFLTSEILDYKHQEVDILQDVILKAKQLYDRSQQYGTNISDPLKIVNVEKELHRAASYISLDLPAPYRIRDILKLLEHSMSRLENSGNIAPYKRLIQKINSLMANPRYQFVFKNQAAPRSIQELTGEIFRIPVAGKPICILDFSDISAQTLNIVVSVISRLAFELAMWSQRKIPILLVCEEAHRYVPVDVENGFSATRRSISRIAKEGRKYGVSLGIISQRPSEIEPSVVSQCSTVFSMRLSNEHDQNFVRAAIPDGASDLLSFLPSLGTAETMVFGESVNLPMRVILNTIAADSRPHSSNAKFTDLWNSGEISPEYIDGVFESWRTRTIGGEIQASSPAPQPVKTDPIKTDPVKAHPVKTDPVKAHNVQQIENTGWAINQLKEQHTLKGYTDRRSTLGAPNDRQTDVKTVLNKAFHNNI